MITKVKATGKSQQAYLSRLAIVFADDLRIKIVCELYQREMSPKQFYEEFGGGSLSRVNQHFKRLEDYGWLRKVREEGPDSQRRGSVEHFYRARELAVIGYETWALIPYSARVEMSWTTLKTLAERVQEALVAKTLEARPESRLTYTTMNLDEPGWEALLARFEALFDAIFEEQADARLRIWHTNEKPMVATVALMAFESPARPPLPPLPRTTPELVEAVEEPPAPFSYRISRVLASELSRQILAEANERNISAPLFHAEIGGDSIDVIRRRFKALEKAGWLRQVAEKTGGRRRAGRELFYRATGPAIGGREAWATLPDSVKPSASWKAFDDLIDLAKQAIKAGTFDARLDRHLTWSVLRLDQRGWESITSGMDELQTFIFREKERAEARLTRSGERPVPATIGLAAFESPKNAVRAP